MGTVSDKLTYLNQTKGKIKDMINYSGEKITSETTFRDYSKILFENYLDILIDKGEALFENLPHVENDSASDNVTLTNTARASMEIETIPQTSQDGEPSPDNPQDIHCTTGENLIKVTNSDSTEETTYPISLGSKEMYNINGVYDGFVYDEDEDKFYIERKIGKVVLDGSETWNIASDIFYATNINDYATSGNIPFSNYFVGKTNVGTASRFKDYGDLVIGFNYSNSIPRLFISYNKKTNVADFTNWLSTHNTEVVYQLATSTLEEITDTTLISQLRAIKNALSMQGTTHIISTATGENLPFLIKARAIKNFN